MKNNTKYLLHKRLLEEREIKKITFKVASKPVIKPNEEGINSIHLKLQVITKRNKR